MQMLKAYCVRSSEHTVVRGSSVHFSHIHIRRSRQMAFPILMSAGKVPPPIVMGSLQLKGGLKFCFHMTEHIEIAFPFGQSGQA